MKKSDWSKQVDKNIRSIKRLVEKLEKMGLEISITKDVETMTGNLVDHVYVVDRVGSRVVFQKHLLSIYQNK
jgi:ABC-type lipopolysaccharide export system ATPase subunit